MAVTLVTLRNTNQEVVVKYEGATSNSTIVLANLGADTQARNADAPRVNITKIIAMGLVNSGVTLVRDSTNILAFAPENAPDINLTQDGISDNIKNDKDIIVTCSGAQSSGYIVLRKIAGWSTKVELATYGQYDDPDRVGASLTADGSPDRV